MCNCNNGSCDRILSPIDRLHLRIEALERSTESLVGHKKACIADHQSTDARLEKMEKALSEEMAKTREMDDILAGVVKKVGYESPPATLDQKTLDDIVANPGDYEVKVEGISAYSIQPSLPLYANWIGDIRAAKDESWHIHIDPKASPSDIPFSVALEYLKAGRIVRRSNWQNRARVEPRSSGAVGGLRVIHAASLDYGPFEPCLTDLLATNWMVLSEQP